MTHVVEAAANEVKIIELPELDTPFEVFSSIEPQCEQAYLLESMEGPEKLSEYSFIGFNPLLIFTSTAEKTTISNKRTGDTANQISSEPLEILREILRKYKVHEERYRLVGGAVGYISYDAVRNWEKLPDKNDDEYNFPDIEMGVYLDGLIFDHKTGKNFYYYIEKDRRHLLAELLSNKQSNGRLTYTEPKSNVKKHRYEEGVEKAKKYVAIGDIFQVVPSRRFEFNYKGSLLHFYEALRKINPSPYMYYLKHGDRQIIGASPEMLVRVEKGQVETYPIAGTRPRTEDPKINKRLAKELLDDPKECAEHIMLVDLARNDVGKVSVYGSVKVPEFMTVHEYSHVQHIVSRVTGTLRDEYDAFDSLRSVFPAGTVSGAPKVRAMEIIDEIEATRRGPYAGAVGYFGLNGDADFAITIRTLVANGTKAYIQAGGGILADSVPETEWYETEHKAMALLRAMELTGGNEK